MSNTVDTERFIREIELRPSIWACNTDAYMDKFKKRDSWLDMCRLFYDNFDKCSNEEKQKAERTLQRKWKGLRSSYTRELSAQKKKGGTGRRIYIYFKHLSFLRRIVHSKPSNPNSGPTPDSEEEQEEHSEEQENFAKVHIKEEIQEDPTTDLLAETPSTPPNEQINRTPNKPPITQFTGVHGNLPNAQVTETSIDRLTESESIPANEQINGTPNNSPITQFTGVLSNPRNAQLTETSIDQLSEGESNSLNEQINGTPNNPPITQFTGVLSNLRKAQFKKTRTRFSNKPQSLMHINRPAKKFKSNENDEQLTDRKMLTVLTKIINIRDAEKEMERDDDRLFMLSLVNELKKVPEDIKLNIKCDIIQCIKKGQRILPSEHQNHEYQNKQTSSSTQQIINQVSSIQRKRPAASSFQQNLHRQESRVQQIKKEALHTADKPNVCSVSPLCYEISSDDDTSCSE